MRKYEGVAAATAILLASAAGTMVASPAFAQEAAEEDTSGFTDIVVTAQKRQENLQDIPISISAITGAQAELQGLSEVKDIAALAPNLAVFGGTTNAAAAVVSIRGVPTPADETQGFDSPIGLYLDGVYLARSSTASFEVADIERIEVLRGPQGTLFGRNTTGGAVNFITREPSRNARISAKVGYGNYNQVFARGSFDTGGDELRMTFSGLYKARDGVVDNLLQPRDRLDPGGYTTGGFRWAAVLETNDWLKISNTFDYTSTTGVPPATQLAAVGDGQRRPVFVPGFVSVVPAPIRQYLASTTIASPGCTVQISRRRLDSLCLDTAGTSRDRIWGDLLRVEVDLGFADLRSSSSLRRWRNRIEGSDLDGLGGINGFLFTPETTFNGLPAGLLRFIPSLNPPARPAGTAAFVASQPVPRGVTSLFTATNDRRQNQFSQELELISKNEGDFSWVVGGFYFRETGREFNVQSLTIDTNAQVFSTANFGALGPAFAAANPARFRQTTVALGYTAGGRSVAIYGQGEYRPGGKDGRFGATVGIRYTWDRKRLAVFQNGATPFATDALIALNSGRDNFSNWTGNFTLDYRFSDEVNAYARVARGYRSGGFNARQTTNLAANVPLTSFDNEVIWSYEIGVKTQFSNRLRFNASAFLNDYSDLQLSVPIPIGGGGSFGTNVENVGKVRYAGFEIEAEYRPTDNIWFDGNVGYTNKNFRRYLSRNAAGQPADISSVVRPSYSPDVTAGGSANARFPLRGDIDITGRLGVSYTSSYFQFGNPIAAPFIQETRGNARALIDAQVRLGGVTLGSGSKLEFTIWGKNLTDKDYISRSIDFNVLGFAGTIYGDPRTFGGTVGIQF